MCRVHSDIKLHLCAFYFSLHNNCPCAVLNVHLTNGQKRRGKTLKHKKGQTKTEVESHICRLLRSMGFSRWTWNIYCSQNSTKVLFNNHLSMRYFCNSSTFPRPFVILVSDNKPSHFNLLLSKMWKVWQSMCV